jgi:hypothetical protein
VDLAKIEVRKAALELTLPGIVAKVVSNSAVEELDFVSEKDIFGSASVRNHLKQSFR